MFLRRLLHYALGYTQASSQDLKKGGGGGFFERVRKVQTTLNQFHTVCPKIETKFLGKLGNSNVFSAQNQVVSKKKGLHRN